MAGPSWLVDCNRIAKKIKNASGVADPAENFQWASNPTRACPNCHHLIDNSDVAQQWPGLPMGVKFDPSDQEIIYHLLGKAGKEGFAPHPFIGEFIPTVSEEDGICYTHPQNLPGVRQDGSVSHFFHRAIRAFNTGTRKRRKIDSYDSGDVRWHKTGRTKPVNLDGIQRGCKKIMVLYTRGSKSEKTSWVMHQYHLGTEDDEKDGEYVVSKIFYQQQPQQVKHGENNDNGIPESGHPASVVEVDAVTAKSADPGPSCPDKGKQPLEFPVGEELGGVDAIAQDLQLATDLPSLDEFQCQLQNSTFEDQFMGEDAVDLAADGDYLHTGEGSSNWWDEEEENLLNSQQLVEGLSICDEFLLSQSPNREGEDPENSGKARQSNKPRLADYIHLGPETLKRDLEECQNLEFNPPANLDLGTPPEFDLSQLEFDDDFIVNLADDD